MTPVRVNRRTVLHGGALTVAAAAAPAAFAQDSPAAGADGSFVYEVTRSEDDWRSLLSEPEFNILRMGETEFPFTSPYARNNTEGGYHCKGCGLKLFDSKWYSPQEIGFVFFEQSEPNAVLTGIHTADAYGQGEVGHFLEVHCRRCGGHLGHIVSIDHKVLYCINGTAMELRPAKTTG
ncbi:MAG: peptide-methionine (R)-S-oxide reductase [Pseudomonadota bacterium]